MRISWRLPAVIFTVIVFVISSFPISVLADEPVGGYAETDFQRIAENGLGDTMNNYAWSMAEFKGDLYVGTVRNLLYYVGVMLKQKNILPPDFSLPISHPDGNVFTQQWAEDMRGEIWRYHQGGWVRVFQSGVTQVQGMYIPNNPGFRAMTAFTDKWGEEALYAATGEGRLPQHLLLKSTDGITWNRVAAPVLMGNDSRSMMVHNGKLYIAAAGNTVWATDDPKTTGTGDNWQNVADFASSGPGTNVAVVSMASLNGYLYAGTQNDSGFQVFRSNARAPADPQLGEWTQIVNSGAGDMSNTRALTMQVFKNCVYVGSACFPITSDDPPEIRGPKGFELIRINTDDSWELLVGDSEALLPPGDPVTRVPASGWPGGFGNMLNYYCWSMQEKDGILYLGTFDTSSFLRAVSLDDIDDLLGSNELSPQAQEQIRQQMILAVQQAIHTMESHNIGVNYPQLLKLLQADPYYWEAVWTFLVYNFAGADLWKTSDGINWEPVTLNGFNKPYNYGIRTMATGSFYIGTANPFEGFEVLKAPDAAEEGQGLGGEVEPANKLTVILPWLALSSVILAFGVIFILSRRRGCLSQNIKR